MTRALVLDTNIVLDLLLFEDPSTQALRNALADGNSLRWIRDAGMHDELARVLTYPHIAAWSASRTVSASEVLAIFVRQSTEVPAAPAATIQCQDTDDQRFIDLAVAHQAVLLSKDRAVLALRKRLRASGVEVAKSM